MAILCLATDINDLKSRIGDMLVGYTKDDEPVYVKQLGFQGAIAALLSNALKPNLVQTLEHTPALVHGGLLLISRMEPIPSLRQTWLCI